MTAQFVGFSAVGLDVLAGLAQDNTKRCFESRRAEYEQGLLEPAQRFVTGIGPLLQRDVSPGVRADPRVGGSLFRIHNDLRFAPDRPPYKTTLDMLFAEGEGRLGGLLLRLTPHEVQLGTGVFGVRGQRLSRYRSALADDSSAGRLAEAVDRLLDQGAELSEPTRVRLPAGFVPGAPAARFAVRDGFQILRTYPHPDSVTSSEFLPWCAERLATFGPVHRWLVSALSEQAA